MNWRQADQDRARLDQGRARRGSGRQASNDTGAGRQPCLL